MSKFILGIITQLVLLMLFEHKIDSFIVGVLLATFLTGTYVIKFSYLGSYLLTKFNALLNPMRKSITPYKIVNQNHS